MWSAIHTHRMRWNFDVQHNHISLSYHSIYHIHKNICIKQTDNRGKYFKLNTYIVYVYTIRRQQFNCNPNLHYYPPHTYPLWIRLKRDFICDALIQFNWIMYTPAVELFWVTHFCIWINRKISQSLHIVNVHNNQPPR